MSRTEPARLCAKDLAGLSAGELLEIYQPLRDLCQPSVGDRRFAKACRAAFGADHQLVRHVLLGLAPGGDALAAKIWAFGGLHETEPEAVARISADAFDLLVRAAEARRR